MNKKSILEVIKNILLLSEETNVEIELSMAELVDGTKVEVSSLEIGGQVMVVAEDGTKTPAPDSYHELMDGTKIKTEGGIITEIEAPNAPEVDMENESSCQCQKLNKEVEDLKAKLNQMELNFKSENEKLINVNLELAKEMEELNKKPSVEPINLKKEKSYNEMNAFEKFMYEKQLMGK